MAQHTLTVPPELEGWRLDLALPALLSELRRIDAQRLIDQRRVGVPDGMARARRPVIAGETITVCLPDPPIIAPSSLTLDIVYEDADLFVVDKPAGLVVHPATGHRDDTLLNALAAYTPTVPAATEGERPSLVHRLDKDTSGLLVVARTRQAHRYLAYQWQRQRAVKRYLALVLGQPPQAEGVIDLPLGRDPRRPRLMVPLRDGQPARTRYATIAAYQGYTLLDVQIETGRTHQIRAHLAALGHPGAGDERYGPSQAPPGLTRQFLHAHELLIRLPSTRQPRTFASPLPPDLADVLTSLRP